MQDLLTEAYSKHASMTEENFNLEVDLISNDLYSNRPPNSSMDLDQYKSFILSCIVNYGLTLHEIKAKLHT